MTVPILNFVVHVNLGWHIHLILTETRSAVSEIIRDEVGMIEKSNRGNASRYFLIFFVFSLAAVSYWAWPGFAYSGPHSCPADIANLSFQVYGSSKILGPPLFSEEQVLLTTPSTVYIVFLYNSPGNNLTQLFSEPHELGTSNVLWIPNPFTGEVEWVTNNSTGTSVSYVNVTYQGIHSARVLYKIQANGSAQGYTYLLAIPCITPGLLVTIGSIPYWGPLPFGELQLFALLIDLGVSFVFAAIVCLVLRARLVRKYA